MENLDFLSKIILLLQDISVLLKDIPDIVEFIKTLEDKYQQLANIIEGNNLGTWEWDIQTDEIHANDQWANMIGYSLEELQPTNSTSLKKFIDPKSFKSSREMLKKHLNGETTYYESEVKIRHKDGRWIWIHDKGKVTKRDAHGNPLKLFGTHSDITLRKQVEENLKESRKRFFLALAETEAGLWDIDMVNNTVFLSSMWKSILGYEDHEIENSFDSWEKLCHPNDKDMIQKKMNDYIEGKSKEYNLLHRLRHKDGSWRWIISRGGILKDDNGKPYRFIGTHIDITARQKETLELERFFSINLDMLAMIDVDGYFIKINKAWEDTLGYSINELKGYHLSDLIHKDDIKLSLETLKELKKGKGSCNLINRLIGKNGTFFYIEWRANLYKGVIYASGRDITERTQYEKKILEISSRDSLTNAYNRRYIYDRAEEIIEEYKRTGKIFSICILDIDDFKKINDNYGHQAGDYILKEFTRIIDLNLRPYDLLGRYGGEEFIIILSNIDEKESSLVIERILNIIRDTIFTFNRQDINFTFSAGISNCKDIKGDKIIIDELVEIADQRMYHAKKTGKNKVLFKV